MLGKGEALRVQVNHAAEPLTPLNEELPARHEGVLGAEPVRVIRRASSVALSTSDRFRRLTISRVSMPLAARISLSPSRRDGAGKRACVTVPKTTAMIGW